MLLLHCAGLGRLHALLAPLLPAWLLLAHQKHTCQYCCEQPQNSGLHKGRNRGYPTTGCCLEKKTPSQLRPHHFLLLVVFVTWLHPSCRMFCLCLASDSMLHQHIIGAPPPVAAVVALHRPPVLPPGNSITAVPPPLAAALLRCLPCCNQQTVTPCRHSCLAPSCYPYFPALLLFPALLTACCRNILVRVVPLVGATSSTTLTSMAAGSKGSRQCHHHLLLLLCFVGRCCTLACTLLAPLPLPSWPPTLCYT